MDESQFTVGGAVLAVGALLAEVLRRWLKSLTAAGLARAKLDSDARVAEAKTMERVNETTERSVDAMIAHSKSEAQVVAELHAVREAVRDLERHVDEVADRMTRFEEFKKRAVYRPGED